MVTSSHSITSWIVSEKEEQLTLTSRWQSEVSSLVGLLIIIALVLWFLSALSLLSAVYVVAVSSLCLLLWKVLLAKTKNENWRLLYIFMLTPLTIIGLLFVGLFGTLRNLIKGDVFQFDRCADRLAHNGKHLAWLSDIKKVEVIEEVTVKKWPASREINRYFWLIKTDGHKIDIFSQTQETELLASIVAEFLGCPLGQQTVMDDL